MTNGLESPGNDIPAAWNRLYRSRGAEVSSHRPYFTGDIFQSVEVTKVESDGKLNVQKLNLAILQHPCALRQNGSALRSQLLVAEVKNHPVLSPSEWSGSFRVMPLPRLTSSAITNPSTPNSGETSHAIAFGELHVIDSAKIVNRIACMSTLGVNLLMQRWVNFNSRVKIPCWQFSEQIAPVYEEADLMEEWCEELARTGVDQIIACQRFEDWIRQGPKDQTRQDRLKDPQWRSIIRKESRDALAVQIKGSIQ